MRLYIICNFNILMFFDLKEKIGLKNKFVGKIKFEIM